TGSGSVDVVEALGSVTGAGDAAGGEPTWCRLATPTVAAARTTTNALPATRARRRPICRPLRASLRSDASPAGTATSANSAVRARSTSSGVIELDLGDVVVFQRDADAPVRLPQRGRGPVGTAPQRAAELRRREPRAVVEKERHALANR